MANGKAGFGIYSDGSKIQNRIRDGSSIFTAEAEAIFRAMEIAKSLPNENVAIFTDSLSCLTAIQNTFNSSTQIQKILNLLHKSEGKKFHLIWIPSHKGIAKNEEADQLAAQSLTRSSENGVYHWSDLKQIIEKKAKYEWNHYWEERNKNTFIHQAANGRNSFLISELGNRHDTKKLDRTRTGVTKLTHEHIITKSDIPKCKLCGQNLTIPHIMQNCSQLEDARDK